MERLDNSQELWELLAREFIKSHQDFLLHSQNNLAHNALEALRLNLHTLKGSASAIGADLLTLEAEHLEQKLKQGQTLNRDELSQQLQRLNTLLQRCLHYLEQELAEH